MKTQDEMLMQVITDELRAMCGQLYADGKLEHGAMMESDYYVWADGMVRKFRQVEMEEALRQHEANLETDEKESDN